TTVRERRMGSGHPRVPSRRHSDSRATKGADRAYERGTTMGRGARTGAARERQTGSSQGGVGTSNNPAGGHAAIPRRVRQGEPAQGERRGFEGVRAPDPSPAGTW